MDSIKTWNKSLSFISSQFDKKSYYLEQTLCCLSNLPRAQLERWGWVSPSYHSKLTGCPHSPVRPPHANWGSGAYSFHHPQPTTTTDPNRGRTPKLSWNWQGCCKQKQQLVLFQSLVTLSSLSWVWKKLMIAQWSLEFVFVWLQKLVAKTRTHGLGWNVRPTQSFEPKSVL